MNPSSLPAGTEVGNWRVLSLRGRGSYGAVYRVEKVGEEEAGPFALKLATHPQDPRFEREVELLSRLRHPHVPELRGRGWWTGEGGAQFPYLVMQWVEGMSLYEWGAQCPRTSRQVLRLLGQLARALEATHAAGCLHRDVKGDNVLVRAEDAHAWLMDFGAGDYRGARTLTQQLMPPGTPEYRSPEAVRFLLQWQYSFAARYEAGPADDVYSLGVTAYRLVTGTYPPTWVDPKSEFNPRGARLPSLRPPRKVATVSRELDALIMRMLAKRPEARGSMGELAQALEQATVGADSKADQVITLRQATTVRMIRSVLTRYPSGWLPQLATAVMVVAVLAWAAMHRQRSEVPVEVTQEEPAVGGRDGGSAGLADASPTIVAGVGPSQSVPDRIGKDMPKKPLPGQRQPPCEKPEIELNGGCWVLPSNATPPCGARSYEWKNGCYWPSFDSPRPSTSEQP